MSQDLDDKDQRVLDILRNDASTSMAEIGRKIGLSESATRRRIGILRRTGVIKRFTVEIDLGPTANAMTLISVNPSSRTPEIANALRSIRGVEVIYEITGEYDIAVILSAANIGEVNQCIDEIRRMNGVSDSNTIIILRELR